MSIPPPHIHIKYGDYEAVMELNNLNIIQGSIPRKCRQMVREWAEFNQQELLDSGTARTSILFPHWSNIH
ncbi:MAG TPA: DUF4160 domain-containing protein [Leptospiraceae bacterium]|nr:DUF4160 domain-containing protein [Leptospiraceae bacterium]HNF13114.1 DUF4160 domain-containing protein [Leptospiraceae bacterium]HNH09903.1 DUF4160 domain-containing protein [Leptospiraceae bacterium]HNI94731.1 DUF4160 domain-containing protein [Leptospiraceae bacterium]HNM02028.1 DUF4160 domain-containing protein [Leptospiraceae bacterium]